MKTLFLLKNHNKEKVSLVFSSLVAGILSIVSWYISYVHNLTTTYNDAMAHLNISRLLIDNVQPGLTQLGGVWLPMNHILPILFIWNNWAWHSGFAGSIYSMIAYVISVLGIYKIVKILTQKIFPSLIGAFAFALNMNMLYLQTTPLTEPLFLMFFIISAYFFLKWIKIEKIEYLIGFGIVGFLEVLTRYDGWFVSAIALALLFLHQIVNKKDTFLTALGKLSFAILPIFFGIILWLLWNLLIFGNPLFFAVGPYSAHAQQAAIQQKSGLITYHNIYYSFLSYFYAIKDNVGLYVFLASLLGFLSFLFSKTQKSRAKQANRLLTRSEKLTFSAFLLTPIIFNVLALYMGFSILNLPELHWNPSLNASGAWFNVRYGILALPFAAIYVSILSSWKKLIGILIIALIFSQLYFNYQAGIITITDGTIGSSSFVNNDVAQKLHQLVKPEDTVLIATSYFSAVDFKSGINLHQIIHEGVSKEWQQALINPKNYATWIVMAKSNVGDPVYSALVTKENSSFLKYYTLSYSGKNANIYQLKTQNGIFVTRNGKNLKLGNQQFIVNGVNSYDFAYRTNKEISQDMQSLHNIGVTTVRFWAFGDGTKEGFQPTAGVYNEARFEKMDYVIQQAQKNNIRLIPTLVNNWKEYGGKQQYLSWAGNKSNKTDEFYNDPKTISLFENYINYVISRKNTITNIPYANDPTIMAWDIMNEPTVTTSKDQTKLVTWTSTISSYIKSLDRNHLVTIGTEQTTLTTKKQANALCTINAIGICSVHLYLYVNEKNIYANYNQINQYLTNQISLANSLDKPIMLEEFGISKATKPFGQNPLVVMKNIITMTNSLHYSGYLFWNWQDKPDTSFGFTPTGNAQGIYSLMDLSNLINN